MLALIMRCFRKIFATLLSMNTTIDETYYELRTPIQIMERLTARSLIAISRSSDEYVSGERSRVRIVSALVLDFIVLLNAIKFGITAAINEVNII